MRATIEVALPTDEAFEVLLDELTLSLARRGISLVAGPQGRVTQDDVEVGRVAAWEPGRRLQLDWRPADWLPETATQLELRFEPVPSGTRVTVEHRGWGGLLADQGGELVGWFADEVLAPLLTAIAPAGFGDWLTDRSVRRPTGGRARGTYSDPLFHRPNFKAILQTLALGPGDHLLEVGCGGGAFLQDALRSGCRAAAVDHSPDMVRTARRANSATIAEGRLRIEEAEADRLPFAEETFTCAVMTGVVGFLPDPVAALAEIRRVLAEGGRLVVFSGSPELRGTPAAPYPFASRIRFFEDVELVDAARQAGFAEAAVTRPDLSGFAREVGVPEDALPLFAGRGGQLLVARR